jgi:eukaryotic-like serine/threonine-protein kinase
MTPARFQTIEEIFLAALEQEPDQVSAFLDAACEGDAVLRREVETLLASDQRAARFIERSTIGLATKIIENRQADSLVGQTIGHYKISESIGTGGMGEVYLVTDIVAGRKAAVKLLPLRFTGDAARLQRFEQEAHAVVALNHPNILTVYEIGEDNFVHYIASELIEGETLRQRLAHKPMQLSEAVDIAIQVASALAAAHQAGIVHRDIKPENIMLRPDGYVKVLDFGIAKLVEDELPAAMPRDQALLLVETNLGAVLGTVRYMSPEQACGAHVDKSTDIWSLGVVLYEMVTGHAPFTGDTPSEVMSTILEKEPPRITRFNAHAPAELQQIISKTLRKDRGQRYHSAHELLEALKGLRHKLEVEAELKRSSAVPLWLRWIRSPAALVLVLLVAGLALTLPFYLHRNLTTTSPPDKSIAVLPFENLSEDEENAFFAAGVQDEILTDLAKVTDLKVISRTSVMKYKSDLERNLREIAKALGVSHVVEGSVQRAGGRVRVNAQLIDARNDAHLWAEHYDRDVKDVFAIQTEIAQQIVNQLRAQLSPAEKAAIAERPTTDLVAYAFYTKAKEIDVWDNWEDAEKSMAQKVELLEKATQRDPNFALAYCALAKGQADLGNLELAKKGAEAALRVRPDLGEGHRELARYYYYTSDFDRAHDELIVARGRLPNDSETFRIAAEIDRIQNRWDASLANFQKASELDPRNVEVAWHLGRTYLRIRRYSELEQLMTKEAASGGGPLEDPRVNMVLAEIKLAQGDPMAAQSLLERVPLDFSPTGQIWDTRFTAALYLRDYDAADHVIAATPARWAEVIGREHPKSWADGEIARARDGKQKALAVFAAARKKLDATLGGKPKDEWYFALAAALDAGCGQKEEAIREALHAVDLKPIAKDAYWGPALVTNLALVYAWTGERDRALEQLEEVVTLPGLGPTYGDLRFNPCWDDLRGDPRFEKILEESKNPVTLTTALPPQKSIAVLPFENLSKDEENAFFAGGVQDEILTDLAKIADLKVISRTSVMQYKSGPERNLREIAKALGVSYVVEGSVQRVGERVRVSAQLIDARNDTHVWAERYDRDVADVFAIQSEIAQQIAEQLQAKLSAAEKAAIAERPTTDLVAYAYYTKAQEIDVWSNWEGWEKSANQKVELLEKAVQRDPNFALAYCVLAKTQLYLAHDPKHFELGKKAAEAALRVRPDLGEAHLELARYYFYAAIFTDRNGYDRARDELRIARRKLPNNSEALLIAAKIDRHQNRWDSAVANLRKATELDPRDVEAGYWRGMTYFEMRRYSEYEQLLTKDAASGDPWSQCWLARIKLAQGDPVAAQSLLDQVPLDFRPAREVWWPRFDAALYLRDYGAASRVIASTPGEWADEAAVAEGQVARARGDKQKALAAFATAREKTDAIWGPKDDIDYLRAVSEIDAGLGRKDEAIREAQRAVDLTPIAKDPLERTYSVVNLALVYAWTGEHDRALEQLEIVAAIPAGPTYGDLRFNPCWDSLRGDPRFDKIVAAAKAASK